MFRRHLHHKEQEDERLEEFGLWRQVATDSGAKRWARLSDPVQPLLGANNFENPNKVAISAQDRIVTAGIA